MKIFGFVCLLFTAITVAQQPPQSVVPADPAGLASIEGIVFGADHQPLSGVKVSFRGLPVAEATSDNFGRFSFEGLVPGSYTLTAFHGGYVYYPQPPVVSALLKLTAGQHVAGIAIVLSPMAVLSGKVTDETGGPLPGVMVRPVQRDQVVNGHLRMGGATGTDVETDAQGEYRVMVDPGRWYLRFAPVRRLSLSRAAPDGPELNYVTTYYPGVRDTSQASRLDILSGQQMPELNVRLRKTPVYHVRGKVVGSVAGSLRIGAFQATEGFYDDSDDGQAVQQDGTFDIAGLSSGAWMLLVVSGGGGLFDFSSMGQATVEIVDRDVEDVSIAALAAVDIDGSIKTAPEHSDANAYHPVELRLEPLYPSDFSIGTKVRNDGTFTLEKLPQGKYRVGLTPPPGGYVKSVTFDGRECIDTGIDVNGSVGPAGLQIVVSLTAGQIVGSVTNPNGAAPSISTITLVPDGPAATVYRPELNLTVRTDPSGQFVIKDVVPGTYRAYAWERLEPISETGLLNETIAFPDPAFPRLFDDMSALVTVGEGESRQVSLALISAAKMEVESSRR